LVDTGTFESLMQAGQFVQVIEERQGMKIGCIEVRIEWDSLIRLTKSSRTMVKSGYGSYLESVKS
jgi:glucose-1-phosphate thymidylyltransferase